MSQPLNVWNGLRSGNQAFRPDTDGPSGSPHDGGPLAAVFRCSDADVASEIVLGQRWGSLLDVSTWGHVVDAGVLASLEHAVVSMGIPLIVVLGHHDCTAMHAAMRAWRNAEIPDGASRVAVEQALSSIVRYGCAAEGVDAIGAAHVVAVGMSLMERSPLIARQVDAGKCGIVCAATDADGRLHTYGTAGALGEAGDSLLERV